MLPLAQIKRQVMMRLRRETEMKISDLAFAQGLKTGPFCVHVMETIALCPPEKFHAALAEFIKESKTR